MSLIKRGNSPYWYFSFRMGGKLYSASTKTTNRAKAAQIENKRRNEVHAILEMGECEPIKFKDACDMFLRTKGKTSNYKQYRSTCGKLMGSVLSNDGNKTTITLEGIDGDSWVHDITQSKIQRIIVDRENRYSDASIQNEMMTLTQIIQNAKKLDFRVPQKLNIPKVEVVTNRLRWLTDEEEEAVLAELNRYSRVHTYQYDMAILMLDTGMRIGEARALPWSSVDLDAKTVTVWRTKVRNQSVLKMTDRLHSVLVKRYENRKNTWVFPAKWNSNGHIKNTQLSFQSAFERAGLNEPDVVEQKGCKATPHIFRKTFASRLVSAGVPMKMVSELLGHSTVVTTERAYGFLAPNLAADAAVDVLNRRSSEDQHLHIGRVMENDSKTATDGNSADA